MERLNLWEFPGTEELVESCINLLAKNSLIFLKKEFFLAGRNLWQKNCISIVRFIEGRIIR